MHYRNSLVLLAIGCVGCASPTGDHSDLQEGSGDYSYDSKIGPDGEVVFEAHELTKREREAIRERDMLWADYIDYALNAGAERSFEGFNHWLLENDIPDPYVVLFDDMERAQQGEGGAVHREKLSSSTNVLTCLLAESQGTLGAKVYTEKDFGGSMMCVYGSEGHLSLPDVAGGVFDRNIYSVKTYYGSMETVWGSHSHDALISEFLSVPESPWQYRYDRTLHPFRVAS